MWDGLEWDVNGFEWDVNRFHWDVNGFEWDVNGFKWCGMDWNGMFMPCPSGAGWLPIYLGVC